VTLIYHITARDAALVARRSGEYHADSLSEVGFIHFSQRHQVLDVANALYAGQKGLVILVVEPSLLKAELKYGPPAHPTASATMPSAENLFPHLYGPLNFDAVVDVVDFPPGADGRFVLPPTLN
jgi:uncharacterized protein (DUF952 family)